MSHASIEIKSQRKPSRALIMRTIGEYISRGADWMDVYWGENWIELGIQNGHWVGYGWIKDIGGDDIAKELNEMTRSIAA